MSDPTPDDLVNANLDRLDGEQIRNYAERAQAEIERLQAALERMDDLSGDRSWCTADGVRVMVPIAWIREALDE